MVGPTFSREYARLAHLRTIISIIQLDVIISKHNPSYKEIFIHQFSLKPKIQEIQKEH